MSHFSCHKRCMLLYDIQFVIAAANAVGIRKIDIVKPTDSQILHEEWHNNLSHLLGIIICYVVLYIAFVTFDRRKAMLKFYSMSFEITRR